MQADPSASSRIKRDNSMVLSSSLSSSEASGPAKVPRIAGSSSTSGANTSSSGGASNKTKGKKKSSVKASTVVSTAVPSVPAGPPPSFSPFPQGSIGRTCKFHLKHLFLGEPKCTPPNGQTCLLHHQRHVKSTRKDDLLAFLAHKCQNDPQYHDLCREIQLKA